MLLAASSACGDAGSTSADDADGTAGPGTGASTSAQMTTGGGGMPPQCSVGKDSCDGPPDDENGCETSLEQSSSCGHCARDCGEDACLITQTLWSCQVKGHAVDPNGPVLALAASGANVYWTTLTELHWLNVETATTEAVSIAVGDIAADEDGVYAATPSGEVLAVTFPGGMLTTLASNRTSPRLVRADTSSIYWVEGAAILRASKVPGAVETFYDQLLDMQVRDLELDPQRVWVGAFESTGLGVTYLSIDKATRSPAVLTSLGADVDPATIEIEVEGDVVYVASVDAIRPYRSDGTPRPTVEGQWAEPGMIGDMLVRAPFVLYRSEQQHAVLRSSDGFDTLLYDQAVNHLALGDRVFFSSGNGVFSSALLPAAR